MKQTKQKEAIMGAVQSLHTHPTADEIYAILKKDNDKLSLGTVYRNLNRFVEKGDIRKVFVHGLSDRFDFRLDEHEHIICQKCDKVYDVNINLDTSGFIVDDGIKITGYKLMLYGICDNCQTNV